jgi:hypothetical protein
MPTPADLAEERGRRWWHRRASVRTLQRASDFVEDVGFALVFGLPDRSMPSLADAARDREGTGEGEGEGSRDWWGPDIERVWGWKDELPKRGMAWYGRFVRGRPSLLAPSLLRELYPRSGGSADFREARLGADAGRIAEILLLNGPTSTAVLREATDALGPKGRSRFDKALSELGRNLVVTHAGVEEQDSGWPAAILTLTATAFDLRGAGMGGSKDRDGRRLGAARRFLDTMVQARPYELGNAFGWGADAARQAFDMLVEAGEARRVGPAYRPAKPGPGRS